MRKEVEVARDSWIALHRLVYAIAPLGVLHFWWMVKRDVTQPAIFAVVLAVLLGYRIVARMRAASRSPLGAEQSTESVRANRPGRVRMGPEYR